MITETNLFLGHFTITLLCYRRNKAFHYMPLQVINFGVVMASLSASCNSTIHCVLFLIFHQYFWILHIIYYKCNMSKSQASNRAPWNTTASGSFDKLPTVTCSVAEVRQVKTLQDLLFSGDNRKEDPEQILILPNIWRQLYTELCNTVICASAPGWPE